MSIKFEHLRQGKFKKDIEKKLKEMKEIKEKHLTSTK